MPKRDSAPTVPRVGSNCSPPTPTRAARSTASCSAGPPRRPARSTAATSTSSRTAFPSAAACATTVRPACRPLVGLPRHRRCAEGRRQPRPPTAARSSSRPCKWASSAAWWSSAMPVAQPSAVGSPGSTRASASSTSRERRAGSSCTPGTTTRPSASTRTCSSGTHTRSSDSPEFRYTTLGEGDDALAGIMDATGFLPEGVPASWSIYFGTADVDGTLAKVADLGGATVTPAEDTPYGRLATCTDSTGALVQAQVHAALDGSARRG